MPSKEECQDVKEISSEQKPFTLW